ncbi:MAG: ribonuclease Z [Acidimicrobiia bacterium]|nr:ribonuclease Z [Acidimicrobiia bacterium]
MASARELIVLGTAGQSPTLTRSQSSYVLRWLDELIVIDPGEGTQRQLLSSEVHTSRITRVLVTHFHGDHCLGLPGLVQRRRLLGAHAPLPIHYGEWGDEHLDGLLTGSDIDFDLGIERHPHAPGTIEHLGALDLTGLALDHSVATIGWRLDEPAGPHLLPERLDELGIQGADIGRLRSEGRLELDGRTVELDEVSEVRRGRSFAFVMDTRLCDNARRLAEGVDLLVCESTYLHDDADRARDNGHLTAIQAAQLAADAGVGRLVLSHFSERYDDLDPFEHEAATIFPDVVVARDLDVVPVP